MTIGLTFFSLLNVEYFLQYFTQEILWFCPCMIFGKMNEL